MSEEAWDEEIDEALAAEIAARLDPALAKRRGQGKVELKDLIGNCVDSALAGTNATTRAAALWAEAAGEAGSRHTCGIYVRENGAGELPTLLVYLDGHSFVYEFATDHLLYEQRMAYLGFPVREIEFRLSNRKAPSRPMRVPSREGSAQHAAREAPAAREPASLSQAEEEWARGLVDDLPDPLADAILGAIRASKRAGGK